jgi:hypothetical protein
MNSTGIGCQFNRQSGKGTTIACFVRAASSHCGVPGVNVGIPPKAYSGTLPFEHRMPGDQFSRTTATLVPDVAAVLGMTGAFGCRRVCEEQASPVWGNADRSDANARSGKRHTRLKRYLRINSARGGYRSKFIPTIQIELRKSTRDAIEIRIHNNGKSK